MASSQERLLETLVREGRVGGVIGAFLGDRWAEALAEAGSVPLSESVPMGESVPKRESVPKGESVPKAGSVPIVNVGDASEIRSVPSVVTDNVAVGRLAARHLLETGARAFGVVRDAASHASRLRAEGFALAR